MTIIAAEQYNGLCHISISPISYGQTVWLFAQQDKKRIKKTRQKRAKQRKKRERKRKNNKRKKEPEQPPQAYGQPAWPSAAAAPNDFPPRKKIKKKKQKTKNRSNLPWLTARLLGLLPLLLLMNFHQCLAPHCLVILLCVCMRDI